MKKVIYTLLIAFVALSCEKQSCDCTEKHQMKLSFQLQKDGQNITIGQEFSDDSLAVMVSNLRFYLSHMKFRKTDKFLVDASTVEIIDLKEEGLKNYEFTLDAGTYEAIELGVGLDAAQNASFPADFPVEHPLSSYYQMYWSWAAKYKFMEFEGFSNPSGSIGSGDVNFSYHPGVDEFYEKYEIPVAFTVSEGGTSVVVNIDYDTIFKGTNGDVNIITENTSHTTPADYTIAERIILNFGESLSATTL